MKYIDSFLTQLLTLVVLGLTVSSGFAVPSQSRRVAEVPFEIENNLVMLRVSVNGSSPRSFILDTGASSSVVNESRVKELGLKFEGEAEATTDSGSVGISFAKGVTLNLANVEFSEINLAAIRLSGLEAGLGRRVDGILGFDIFNRYVVEVDYESRVVRLYEPGVYKYSGAGQVISITIEDNIPFIRLTVIQPGEVSGAGKFEFDIGQVGAVTLSKAFVSSNSLLKPDQKVLEITTGAIQAGRSRGRIARISQLRLGRFTIHNPVVNFSQNTQEPGETENAGLIGGEILRRFRVIVDYSRKQVILERNKRFIEPYEFDMSGLSLAAEGDQLRTYRVRTLIENSPATEAGIAVGDVITRINGGASELLTLSQIRQMFRQAGREYVLTIMRDKTPSQITIKTRRLV